MRSSGLVLFFPFLPAILFACAPDEFYTPNTCLLYGVVSTFGCRKCPANAVQYSQADESCVCKRGYYATNSRRLCNDYLGNGCGTCRVWPMVDDGFDCTPCAAGGSDVCVGDAYDVPVVMGAYWAGTFYVQDDFYVRCDRVGCPASGYMRIPMAYATAIQGVTWRLQHAPRRQCLIYGQTVPNPTVSSDCVCPANSYIKDAVSKQPGKADPGIVLEGGYMYSDVWNYNVAPAYEPTPGAIAKYFGRCVFHYTRCLFYCTRHIKGMPSHMISHSPLSIICNYPFCCVSLFASTTAASAILATIGTMLPASPPHACPAPPAPTAPVAVSGTGAWPAGPRPLGRLPPPLWIATSATGVARMVVSGATSGSATPSTGHARRVPTGPTVLQVRVTSTWIFFAMLGTTAVVWAIRSRTPVQQVPTVIALAESVRLAVLENTRSPR